MALSEEALRADTSSVTDLYSNASNLEAELSSIVGEVSGENLHGGLVGINDASIPAMKRAIEEYVEALHKHLDQVESNFETGGAMRGEYAAAVSRFVFAIKTACKKLTGKLLAFNELLDQVHQQFVAKDQEMAKEISGQNLNIY